MRINDERWIEEYQRIVSSNLMPHNRVSMHDSQELKSMLDHELVFEPKVWMTVGFKRTLSVDMARDSIVKMLRELSYSALRCHILPIVGYNPVDGKVQGDVHYTLLCDDIGRYKGDRILIAGAVEDYFKRSNNRYWRVDVRKSSEDYHTTEHVKALFPFGNRDIHPYDVERGCINYTVLRHMSMTTQIFCPNRGSCKRRRGRNKCIYRRDIGRLRKDCLE